MAEPTCQWPTSHTLDSIAHIESGNNSRTSGVVVSNNLVITAAHVFEDLTDTVVVVNNQRYGTSV